VESPASQRQSAFDFDITDLASTTIFLRGLRPLG
jgi:hypothetical protein